MRAVVKFRLLQPSGPHVPRFQIDTLSTFRSRPQSLAAPSSLFWPKSHAQRVFSSSVRGSKEVASGTDRAKRLKQDEQEEQEDQFDKQIDDSVGEARELQARRPWHREGSDEKPVKRMDAGSTTKGLFITISLS